MSNSKYDVREGFQVRETKVALPKDTSHLDPTTKKDLAICNLFVNERLTIADIIRLADEDYANVIQALLKQNVIVDRRQKPRPVKQAERQN